jgi:hypothetical protein
MPRRGACGTIGSSADGGSAFRRHGFGGWRWRRQVSHSRRVILYITHSRPNSVNDPAAIQPTRWKTVRIATLAGSVEAPTTSAAACSKSGLLGEFGYGHGVCGHHGPPFLLDLAGLQCPEQQLRSADPDVPGTCFRVQPVFGIHGPKIALAVASREAANRTAGRPLLTAGRQLVRLWMRQFEVWGCPPETRRVLLCGNHPQGDR